MIESCIEFHIHLGLEIILREPLSIAKILYIPIYIPIYIPMKTISCKSSQMHQREQINQIYAQFKLQRPWIQWDRLKNRLLICTGHAEQQCILYT